MPEKNPIVSVIIPTYNRAHLIGRAIQSVLNQTYQDLEVIVVDDGSTDNTEEIVKNFSDFRIRYLRHEENRGAAAARNTGIKAARGKYIAFQDSDDEWLPEKLEKQMKVFVNAPEKVGIVYTDMWRITKNKRKYYFSSPMITPEDRIIYKQALDYKVMNIGIGTAVVKREVFKKVGMFDGKFPRFIDLEFFIRVSKHYYFYHLGEPLVNYFEADNGISTKTKSSIKAQKLILEKYFKDIERDKKVLARHYLGIAVALCKNGEIEEGEIYFAKAFKTYPDIKRNRNLLSKHYFDIGHKLCLNNKFKEGRNYLIKAVKTYPFNTKYLLVTFLSLFGDGVYCKSIETYLKLKLRM